MAVVAISGDVRRANRLNEANEYSWVFRAAFTNPHAEFGNNLTALERNQGTDVGSMQTNNLHAPEKTEYSFSRKD
jgi:hypothetical protein